MIRGKRPPAGRRTIRERLAALALLAHPPAARTARGDEMTGTLLDASAGSRRRLARELADLARAGLRARAEETARGGAGRLVADGLCLAGVWVMTLDIATLLSWRVRGLEGPLLGWPSIALLAGALAVTLLGFDRLGGATALAWTAFRLPALLHVHPGMLGFVPEILPVLCFAVMVLAPRHRPPDARRLAWLIVPLWLVLTFGPPSAEQSPLLVVGVVVGAIAAVALAAALLPADPRLAIAGAVPLTSVAIAVAASRARRRAADLAHGRGHPGRPRDHTHPNPPSHLKGTVPFRFVLGVSRWLPRLSVACHDIHEPSSSRASTTSTRGARNAGRSTSTIATA